MKETFWRFMEGSRVSEAEGRFARFLTTGASFSRTASSSVEGVNGEDPKDDEEDEGGEEDFLRELLLLEGVSLEVPRDDAGEALSSVSMIVSLLVSSGARFFADISRQPRAGTGRQKRM